MLNKDFFPYPHFIYHSIYEGQITSINIYLNSSPCECSNWLSLLIKLTMLSDTYLWKTFFLPTQQFTTHSHHSFTLAIVINGTSSSALLWGLERKQLVFVRKTKAIMKSVTQINLWFSICFWCWGDIKTREMRMYVCLLREWELHCLLTN